MFDIMRLSNYYPIKPVINVKDMDNGKTSRAKKIVTTDGNYILRKINNSNQATTEYVISKRLAEIGISPLILLNNDNQPFISNRKDIYNLQPFVINDGKGSIKSTTFYNLGHTISLFHSRTKDMTGIYEQKDRFSLEVMWAEIMENHISDFNKLDRNSQLKTLVEQCLSYNVNNNCYIHGDLGVWNLLFNKEQVYLIDFSEVRKGNNHFDISAVLSSAIDWTKEDKEITQSLINFREGYTTDFDLFNWSALQEHLTLWFTRGIMAIFLKYGIGEKTSHYIKETIHRKERLDHILRTIV